MTLRDLYVIIVLSSFTIFGLCLTLGVIIICSFKKKNTQASYHWNSFLIVFGGKELLTETGVKVQRLVRYTLFTSFFIFITVVSIGLEYDI